MNRADAAKIARAAKLAKQLPLDRIFWSKVDHRGLDECWPWLAAFRGKTPKQNYGAFWMDGRHHPANKIALIFSGVEVPDGMFACHTCDYPPCCNPSHLFVGTQQINMDDKVRKGRQVKGVKCHTAKLTPEDVVEIRAEKPDGRTPNGLCVRIAKKYGITTQYVSEIWHRKSWKDI